MNYLRFDLTGLKLELQSGLKVYNVSLRTANELRLKHEIVRYN